MFRAIGRALESFAGLFFKKPSRPITVVTPPPTPSPDSGPEDIDFELEVAEPSPENKSPEALVIDPNARIRAPVIDDGIELDRAVPTDRPVRVVDQEERAEAEFLCRATDRDEAQARKAIVKAVRAIDQASPSEYATAAGKVAKELFGFPERLRDELLTFLKGYNPRFHALVYSLLCEQKLSASARTPGLKEKAQSYIDEARGQLPAAWQEGLQEADRITKAMPELTSAERASRVDAATAAAGKAGFGYGRPLTGEALRELAAVLPAVEARRPGS